MKVKQQKEGRSGQIRTRGGLSNNAIIVGRTRKATLGKEKGYVHLKERRRDRKNLKRINVAKAKPGG